MNITSRAAAVARRVRHARIGRNLVLIASIAASLALPLLAGAAETGNAAGFFARTPERAVILSGDSAGIHRDVMAVMYDTQELHFQDPGIPRFLLIDSKGSAALGIGGAVEGVFSYDFKGAAPGLSFMPYDIAVPADKAERSQLQGSANHSSIYIKFVKATRLGALVAYAETRFDGSDGGYGFNLLQAYVSLGNVTVGKTRGTFIDAGACLPTIDYQGPCGSNMVRSMMLRYRRLRPQGISWAVSAELASYSGTYTDIYGMGIPVARSAWQRVPDIPAYIQYGWDRGASHVRLSGIFRDMAYRDLITGKTRFTPGWGLQLSGVVKAGSLVTLYCQGIYGKGIATYLNDLSGNGFSLIPDSEPGKMKAPAALGVTAGAQINITRDLFIAGGYSFCRLYDQGSLGADTYKRGNYAVVNAFYTPVEDLRVGVEYIHGTRKDISNLHAEANRLNAMIKYTF